MIRKILSVFASASDSGVLSLFAQLFMFLSLSIFLSQHFVEPASPHLQALLANIEGFGTLAVCAYGIIGCIRIIAMQPSDRIDDNVLGFVALLNKMTIFYTVVLSIMVAIGQHGDAILAKANTDPIALAVDVSSIFLLLMCLFVAEWMIRRTSTHRTMQSETSGACEAYAVASGVNKRAPKKNVMNSEIVNTAVHEAGHFICVGALPDLTLLPDDFEVRVKHVIDEYDGVAGYVSGITFKNTSKAILSFAMLKSLAGQEAERFVFEQDSNGSRTDLVRWEELAKQYLRAYGDEEGLFYYQTPQNASESAYNSQVMITLQNKQRRLLRALFEANHVLLNTVVEQLSQVETIDRASSIKLLSQVTIPQEFPVPIDKNPAQLLPENKKRLFLDKTGIEL